MGKKGLLGSCWLLGIGETWTLEETVASKEMTIFGEVVVFGKRIGFWKGELWRCVNF